MSAIHFQTVWQAISLLQMGQRFLHGKFGGVKFHQCGCAPDLHLWVKKGPVQDRQAQVQAKLAHEGASLVLANRHGAHLSFEFHKLTHFGMELEMLKIDPLEPSDT